MIGIAAYQAQQRHQIHPKRVLGLERGWRGQEEKEKEMIILLLTFRSILSFRINLIIYYLI